ncbi:hypothetical protein BCU39_000630 [Vibrio cyclitrophicus]|uniref:capsular polysaccharide export protein, LipB/KpsS family n=1 Tax=Vibrio cyclitrophicus TaxID=47951 RepID=UPI003907547B
MKIITFDPTYSFYFNDLTNSIEKVFGTKLIKECVSYNFSDRLYLPDYNFIPLGSSDLKVDDIEKYDFVRNIRSLSNVTPEVMENKKLLANISVYKWLENYILDNIDSIFLIYNDLRWNHAFAIDILNKNKCKFFVFERGAFRPYSTTMDSKGVNANSEFRNMAVDSVSLKEMEILKKIFFRKRNIRHHELRFSIFFLMKFFFWPLVNKNVKLASKTSYRKGLLDYVYFYFKKNFKRKANNESNVDLNNDYFFVPLQLSNDTQTLINSEFSNTQEFIDIITDEFRRSNFKGTHSLVFKVHPMDTNIYKFSDDVLVSNDCTTKLLDNSSGCITINSTVGFEGIKNNPVICFGDSFYTNHGFVHKLDKRENPFLYVNNKKSVEDYNYFVLSKYQVPGSIFNYDEDDLVYTAKKILNKI